MQQVTSVSKSDKHKFSKPPVRFINLVAGLGVEGDCHAGVTVKHRSRVARDPTQPNLRQVHFIHAELFDELALAGHVVRPGELGENITTRGIDLLGLPQRARLLIGATAVVEITGLRNPCSQIEDFQAGLLGQVLVKADYGTLVRKSGVMGVVLAGGAVLPGDQIRVELPELPHVPLEMV